MELRQEDRATRALDDLRKLLRASTGQNVITERTYGRALQSAISNAELAKGYVSSKGFPLRCPDTYDKLVYEIDRSLEGNVPADAIVSRINKHLAPHGIELK